MTTDGCTFAPDLSQAVYACCVAHDAAYAVGGTWIQWLESNIALGACIEATSWAVVAWPYMLATTAVGWVFWNRRKPKKDPPKAP